MNYPDILAVAVTLFFVIDPLGNIPVFNAVLARFDARTRSRIMARELTIALAILLMFLFVGNPVMKFVGLTQPTLSLSGGILLFIIALRMIFPRPISSEDAEVVDPFIVPLRSRENHLREPARPGQVLIPVGRAHLARFVGQLLGFIPAARLEVVEGKFEHRDDP